MAKIALTEGFSLIPEGTHIFCITEVVYKEEFGKLEVKMKTAKGQTHTERFNLIKQDGSMNEGAYNAFSFFAKTALGDYTLTEIDHDELVGCFIRCNVEHDVQPSNKDPNKTVTFVRLGDKSVADGFDEAEVPAPAQVNKKAAPATKTVATPQPKKAAAFDLDSLLG